MAQRKIEVLSEGVSRLIAAGEVVERPASVVKELVENSIDAGSRSIVVEIEDGGISLIRVTDDGSGIEKESVKTAFLTHATSKLHSEEDLEKIETLGFRGEALASIAAVSRLCVVTRTAEELAGTRYELEAMRCKYFDDEGCNKGTSISVRDLFFNLPARMKFLKKDATEAAAVGALLNKLALSHPEISFKFIKDGEVKLHTPGNGKLISAIFEVWGKELARAMLPVDYEEDGFKLTGYLVHPTAAKASRSFEYFFVNNRYVKHATLIAALEEGYKNNLLQGKYPACVLNVAVPYSFVDVNVHPAKIDVKFAQDRAIYNLVYSGVKLALQRALQPVVTRQEDEIFKNCDPEAPQFCEPTLEEVKAYSKSETYNRSPALQQKIQQVIASHEQEKQVDLKPPEKPEPSLETKASEPEGFEQESFLEQVQQERENSDVLGKLTFVGEVLGTYIICEAEGKLVVIDKHAAHERLMFEKVKSQEPASFAQTLLEPVVLSVSAPEYACAIENKAVFEQLGFEIDDFGTDTIVARTVPVDLKEKDAEEVILQVIKDLMLGKNKISMAVKDQLLYSIACKAAIKSHDKNTEVELRHLVEELNQKQGLLCCPHGRPVCAVIERKELEKWFLRT